MKQRKTKAERRVELARDVLAQLKLGRFLAVTGKYLAFFLKDGYDISDESGFLSERSPDLETCMQQAEKCQACAVGSMFLTHVDKGNKAGVLKLNPNDIDYHTELMSLFSAEQIGLIEAAFERSSSILPGGVWSENAKTAARAYEHINDANLRLRAIMLNIIRNEGTFVIPRRTLREAA